MGSSITIVITIERAERHRNNTWKKDQEKDINKGNKECEATNTNDSPTSRQGNINPHTKG